MSRAETAFDALKVGDKIRVRVLKSRTEKRLHDTITLAIGVMIE